MPLAQRPLIGAKDLVYAVLDESTDLVGQLPSYGTIKPLTNLAKIGVTYNSASITLDADDRPAFTAETAGKIDIEVELADILPEHYAAILGHRYVNGAISKAANDTSPYLALGFKALRAGKDGTADVYDYIWLYKVKFLKPSFAYETKAETIVFNKVQLKANGVNMIANGLSQVKARTDDPLFPQADKDAYFNAVYFADIDTSAVTPTIAQGSGETKTFTVSLAKGSNSATKRWSIPAASVAALASGIMVAADAAPGTLLTGITAVISAAGTGFTNSPVVITLTSPNSVAGAMSIISIPKNIGCVDSHGINVSPASIKIAVRT